MGSAVVCEYANGTERGRDAQATLFDEEGAVQAVPRIAERLNIDFRLRAANRQFLEDSVFGYINNMAGEASGPIKALFVGIDTHNWHYPHLLKTEF